MICLEEGKESWITSCCDKVFHFLKEHTFCMTDLIYFTKNISIPIFLDPSWFHIVKFCIVMYFIMLTSFTVNTFNMLPAVKTRCH